MVCPGRGVSRPFRERPGPCGRSPPRRAASLSGLWTPPRTPSRRVHKRRRPVAAVVAKPNPRRGRRSQAAPRQSPGAVTSIAGPSDRDPSFTRVSPAPRPSAATAPPTPPQSPPRATPPGTKGATTGRRAGGALETTPGTQRDGRWERTQAERCGGQAGAKLVSATPSRPPPDAQWYVPTGPVALRPPGRRGFPRKRWGCARKGRGLPSHGAWRLHWREGSTCWKGASSSLRRSP